MLAFLTPALMLAVTGPSLKFRFPEALSHSSQRWNLTWGFFVNDLCASQFLFKIITIMILFAIQMQVWKPIATHASSFCEIGRKALVGECMA
jgi:hypothetical protein